jgi:hypothetical protein
MPPSKKISISKTKQPSSLPNSELPQKMKSKKAEQKKRDQVEALSHATQVRAAMPPTPSEDLVRKAKSKKKEHEKQVKTEALAYPDKADGNAFPNPSEHHEKRYFQDLGAKIAQRALELHDRKGKVHGHDLEDWLEAERQIFLEEKA